MLIVVDLADGGANSRLVEPGEQPHRHDSGLVTEHGPAEMGAQVEDHQAGDADGECTDAGGRQQAHPRPDGAQVRLTHRVEVLQTLNDHLRAEIYCSLFNLRDFTFPLKL